MPNSWVAAADALECIFSDISEEGTGTLNANSLSKVDDADVQGKIETIDKIKEENLIIGVIGNRNTGKSTFTRHLVNRLLSTHKEIAYLDCDLGQPEMTPSGLLSLSVLNTPLIGAPFTHNTRQPFACSFYGNSTPINDPELYLTLLRELVQTYRSNLSHMPLIVNTSGWIKGRSYLI